MATTSGRAGSAAQTAQPTVNSSSQPAPAASGPAALFGAGSLPVLDVRPASATLEDRLASEWVLTNGLGGFAMGSASGVPRRRYHAWLIGALTPPVGRHVLLHSAVETFVDATDRRVDACSYQFIGHDLHPRAAEQQTLFRKHFTCLWEYEIKDAASNLHARFSRELALVPGRNAAVVRYRVTRLGAGPLTSFDVRPMTPLRDFHALHPARADAFTTQTLAPAGKPGAVVQPVRVTSGNARVTLALLSPGARAEFTQAPEWWYDFEYHKDRDRGQECIEDIYSPGVYRLTLAGLGVGQTAEFFLQAWGDEGTPPIESASDFDALVTSLADRHSAMLAGIRAHAASTGGAAMGSAVSEEDLSLLVHTADQFIVRRDMPRTGGQSPTSVSVIAGYPWFSDWGRDTMISLPGLFYSTGRFAEARAALETFARLRRRGLIPNCFDDGTGTAMYNTVDAPLWFVHAACRYVEVTGDKSVIDGPIFAAALDVLDAYRRGTDFEIRMDPADGLITAGDPSMQLTWMDAKRDGVVFTPRHGKAVEINALWYNALVSVAELVAP
ncbi:MAG: amylo-alpha-1,6-glucosidase, partial [Planctomycetota bacterium]|nr:amylo-alpha-1,6-glucosidase [Planctomycetota bacterium]